MTGSAKTKGVIFDLDGVLVDTAQFHKQSWYDLAEQQGLEMTDEFFYSTFGMQNKRILPMLFKRDLSKAEIDSLSEWKEDRYRRLIVGKIQLLDGVKELIDDLKSCGFLLAIGSSTPRVNLEFMLKHMPLTNCFDAYVAGEDVANSKPAPDTFLKAAEMLGLAPANCVVVEDAVAGVQAAKAAQMPVVAVTTTTSRESLRQADLVVDSLAQLDGNDFLNLVNQRQNGDNRSL